jgi:hypothetical protein
MNGIICSFRNLCWIFYEYMYKCSSSTIECDDARENSSENRWKAHLFNSNKINLHSKSTLNYCVENTRNRIRSLLFYHPHKVSWNQYRSRVFVSLHWVKKKNVTQSQCLINTEAFSFISATVWYNKCE